MIKWMVFAKIIKPSMLKLSCYVMLKMDGRKAWSSMSQILCAWTAESYGDPPSTEVSLEYWRKSSKAWVQMFSHAKFSDSNWFSKGTHKKSGWPSVLKRSKHSSRSSTAGLLSNTTGGSPR